MWDVICFKYPFHELEEIIYQGIKKVGIKTYAGIMEWRKPVFVVLDLELMKHIL